MANTTISSLYLSNAGKVTLHHLVDEGCLRITTTKRVRRDLDVLADGRSRLTLTGPQNKRRAVFTGHHGSTNTSMPGLNCTVSVGSHSIGVQQSTGGITNMFGVGSGFSTRRGNTVGITNNFVDNGVDTVDDSDNEDDETTCFAERINCDEISLDDLDLSESTRLTVDGVMLVGAEGNLRTETSGYSQLTLQCTKPCVSLTMEASGASVCNVQGIHVDTMSASFSGSADGHVQGQVKSGATLSASGASQLNMTSETRTPAMGTVRLQSSGTATVKAILPATKCVIKASGASQSDHQHTTEDLVVHSTGAASVKARIHRDATSRKKRSGSASISISRC